MPFPIREQPVSAFNCYKCGGTFPRYNQERVCNQCRKPAADRRLGQRGRDLSFREGQIVELIVLAKSNKEIAAALHLTEGTVKEYLNRIFRKLDVHNRTELAVWVLRQRAAA
jgi:DNA-binding NarL/FixJ family response regulator